MTPEQHARAKEVFAAVSATPEEAREAQIAELCAGDKVVQQEVERLLRYLDDRTLRDTIPLEGVLSVTGADVAPPAVVSVPPGSATNPASAERRFVPGDVVAERYRIVDLLGRGGMGEVYRAEDLRLNQDVALKFLTPKLAQRPAIVERFNQEVRLARQVSHPNICRVYDLGEADGTPFISMEYIDGENLATLTKRIGRLPRDKACDVARQLCSGLAAAHARNVLHRDLKPANVMLDGQGHVRLTDFGLAAIARTVHGLEVRAGTPAYMSPEQISGADVTIRSDIYSLGLVLYEVFTGQPAFRGKSIAEYARLHTQSRPPPLVGLVDDLDPRVERIILRCLAKDPADRPESALQVAAALPGGDLLAAALEAGQTLSPETVASAELPYGLGRKTDHYLLAVALAMFALFVAFGDSHRITRIAESQKAPEVLLDRAKEMTADLGLDAGLTHHAYGFCEPTDLGAAVAGIAIHTGPALPIAASEHTVLFWYRRAAEPLAPTTALNMAFNWGRATLADPPSTLATGVTVILNGHGELRAFVAQPGMSATAATDPGQRWRPFLRAAGFEPDTVVSTNPDDRYRILADQRHAWTAVSSRGVQKHIEAASLLGGTLVFAVLATQDETFLDVNAELEQERRSNFARAMFPVFMFLLLMPALPIARTNLVTGRGDRVGAFRVALFMFIVQLMLWTLRASHVTQVNTEVLMLAVAVLVAITYGMVAYVFYLALEPYARRFWPQTIVTWTRVLRGRIWDPAVARHVLVGATAGTFWALMTSHEVDLVTWLGLTPRPELFSARLADPLLGGRAAVALALEVLARGLGRALVFGMLVVLMRILVRRQLLAAILATVIALPTVLPNSAHVGVGILTYGVAGVGVAALLLIRHGLVAVIVAIAVNHLLLACPALRGFDTWYSDHAMSYLGLVLAIMVTSYAAARSAGSKADSTA